jgi:hypothetical protein
MIARDSTQKKNKNSNIFRPIINKLSKKIYNRKRKK